MAAIRTQTLTMPDGSEVSGLVFEAHPDCAFCGDTVDMRWECVYEAGDDDTVMLDLPPVCRDCKKEGSLDDA